MKVLFLGPESPTLAHLRAYGENVTATEEPVGIDAVTGFDFLVRHGYRHILKRDVLHPLPGAVNLHIAYLPWNRGADPNVWSWIEGTPKGVTIHYMDAGVDTGGIIAQRVVRFGDGETLATSYKKLQEEMSELFEEQWPLIRAGECSRHVQKGPGSFHRVADKARVEHRLACRLGDSSGRLGHKKTPTGA